MIGFTLFPPPVVDRRTFDDIDHDIALFGDDDDDDDDECSHGWPIRYCDERKAS